MKVTVVRTDEGWSVEVDGAPVTTHATEEEALATAARLAGRAGGADGESEEGP